LKDPFFLSALGFDSHCDEDENILELKECYSIKDKVVWQDYIMKNYYQYIPSYIKTF